MDNVMKRLVFKITDTGASAYSAISEENFVLFVNETADAPVPFDPNIAEIGTITPLNTQIVSNMTVNEAFEASQGQINALQTTQATGTEINFVNPKVYNSFTTPISGNITNDLTGAKIGFRQKIYHSDTDVPNFPAGWVKMAGDYEIGSVNIITAEWCEALRVEYTIVVAGVGLIDTIYTSHYDRVIADGGIIESETVTKNIITFLVNNYGITTSEDFENNIPIALDPCVWGYKMGTGALSTIGFACQKLYSLNPSADAVQATAGSQPLILTHNDIDGNYAFFPRTTSTVNQAVRCTSTIGFTSASDTLIITAKIFLPNQTATSTDFLVSDTKWSFSLQNRGANALIKWIGVASSSEYTPSATEPHWVRIIATPTEITYQWSADGVSFTTINAGITPGAYGGSATSTLIGYTNARTQNTTKIYHVLIQNTTLGTSLECDMNDFDPEVSEASFVSNGETWNIDMGTETTGLKMQMVTRTLLQGNGIAHKLVSSIAINQPHTAYALIKRGGLGTLSGMAVSSSISNDGTNTTLNNGSALNIANASKNRQFLTVESNGASSKIRVNNGADTVGDAGANNGTYLELFANGASYGNYVLGMYLISQGSDTDVQKSAMYNYFFA